jgi:hypothetical protein
MEGQSGLVAWRISGVHLEEGEKNILDFRCAGHGQNHDSEF